MVLIQGANIGEDRDYFTVSALYKEVSSVGGGIQSA